MQFRDQNDFFCDAHAHLTVPELTGRLARLWRRARRNGLSRICACAVGVDDWPRLERLDRRHPQIVPAFGLHPWTIARTADSPVPAALPRDWLAQLETVLRRHPTAAVGEIGLDGGRDAPERQREFFRLQLETAARLNRPAVIHCVKAWPQLREVLCQFRLERGLLLHAYAGPAELVAPLAELGAFFSFGRALSDPRRHKLRAALAAVPAKRLLFESDTPTADSEPADLPRLLAAAAELRGEPAAELRARTMDNFAILFGDGFLE